jgi:hypothetical protein
MTKIARFRGWIVDEMDEMRKALEEQATCPQPAV